MSTRTSNKRIAERVLANLERIVEARHTGAPLDKVTRDWLLKCPRPIVEYLRRQNLVYDHEIASPKSLDDLIGLWTDDLLRRTTKEYSREASEFVREVICKLGAPTLAQISCGAIDEYLAERQHHYGYCAATHNKRVGQLRSFGLWCVRNMHCDDNPFSGVGRQRAGASVQRRALADDEFRNFIQTTRRSIMALSGHDGDSRARLYLLSATTGLRLSACLSVTWRDLRLIDGVATVFVHGRNMKNRRDKRCALPKWLCEELVRSTSAPVCLDDRVWDISRQRVGEMFRHDRDAAGIPREVDGRLFTFHSLRSQFSVTLQRAGIPKEVVAHLLDHTRQEVTTKHYSGFADSESAKASAVFVSWKG